ncbi:hypothetical protein [Streptomyces sp. NPDC087787]|uniref:hypothetical protein n=1 Tax=Streptomyces sp. NPDC087787 TaxID=3365803 RepID=UPI00380FFE43
MAVFAPSVVASACACFSVRACFSASVLASAGVRARACFSASLLALRLARSFVLAPVLAPCLTSVAVRFSVLRRAPAALRASLAAGTSGRRGRGRFRA